MTLDPLVEPSIPQHSMLVPYWDCVLLLVKPGNPKARRVPKVGENHPNSQKTDLDNVSSNKDWSEVFRFILFFETPTRPCSLHPLLTRMPPTATVDWYSQGLWVPALRPHPIFLKAMAHDHLPFSHFHRGFYTDSKIPQWWVISHIKPCNFSTGKGERRSPAKVPSHA